MTEPDPDELAAARRQVTRHFHRYSSEQRATMAASHRLGHRQRQAVGVYFYTTPARPDVAFDTRDQAARAALRAAKALGDVVELDEP